MAGQFVTDPQIVAALCQPFSLAYAAAKLGTSLSRARSIRDIHKTEIVTARVKEHHQTPDQIAFQLEILEHIDTLKKWYKTYEDRRNDPEQKQVPDQGGRG